MERKIKLYLILGSCLLLVAVLAILNIAICFNPFDSGGCIAVIYDKAAMRAEESVSPVIKCLHFGLSDFLLFISKYGINKM